MRYEDANSRLEANEAATLKLVNDAREKLGLDPLDKLAPGYMSEASSCVISESIKQGATNIKSVHTGGFATTIKYTEQSGMFGLRKTTKDMTIELPQSSRSFIGDFDTGKYKHLDKRRK